MSEAKAFHYDIIREPVVTEKSSLEESKVTFIVANDANKASVKEAVEAIFNVKVEKVNVAVVKGKTKRFRGKEGKRPDRKKAIVTLVEGQSLDLTEGM